MLKQLLLPLLSLCTGLSLAATNYEDLFYGQVYQGQWLYKDNAFVYLSNTPKGRKLYSVDLEKKTKQVITKRPAKQEYPQVTAAAAPAPQVDYKVVVRDNQVFLKKREEERLLAKSPAEGILFLPNVQYSSDKRYAIVMQQKQIEKREIVIVESSPSTQLQPLTRTHKYVKPGDEIAIPYPTLFDLEQGKQIDIDYSDLALGYALNRVKWAKDSKSFSFDYNVRGHQCYQLWSVEAATGKKRIVIEEKSRTFVYYNKLWRHAIKGRDEMIWLSERDGWKHLYLFDTSKSNSIKKQLTKGKWIVREVLYVDEAQETIYFLAAGCYEKENPYFTHLCRVNFDGTGLKDLTPVTGNHLIDISPDKKYFLDTCSTPEKEPVAVIRHLSDGSILMPLEKADASAAEAKGWVRTKSFCAKGRDGKTDIYGNIYLPPNYDPQKKYPIIEQIYAGPHDSHVNQHFKLTNGSQRYTLKDYIVVSIDGMGTYNRSKAFHDVCWKNLKDAGFPDRIAWMKAAAKVYTGMDLSRVGIMGCSAGGQNAMGAVLFHNDFYKAAAAACGCHDNRMDKIWWNELWMGYPIDKSYAESSNVDQAHRLKGSLLLVVGELDNNVDPATTMQVANALIKAKKYFELLVVPGVGHSFGGEYGVLRTMDFFERNLKPHPIPFAQLQAEAETK